MLLDRARRRDVAVRERADVRDQVTNVRLGKRALECRHRQRPAERPRAVQDHAREVDALAGLAVRARIDVEASRGEVARLRVDRGRGEAVATTVV